MENAYTIQVSDPRGDLLRETFGSDIDYSGYVMLHIIMGDQEVIDLADARNHKTMRAFISSLRVMTCSTFLQEYIFTIKNERPKAFPE